MAHPTLEYIRGLRKSLEAKKAEIVGESPSSMPGSEHDSKPPASAKEPDKETKDQTMVPNSGLTTSGAGDDSKITHTHDLLAGQAALTPSKEPEVTGDAEAQVPGGKTAEALAAEIMVGIDAWYKGQKQAADTQGPSSGTGTAEALITDKGKEPEQTKDVISPDKKDEISTDALKPATGEGSSGETAAAAKSAACGGESKEKESACGKGKEEPCCEDGKCGKCAKCKAAASKKCAGALDMELTSDVLAKIAAVMLATEEGTKLAESVLAKAAGEEAAEKTLGFLRAQNDLAQKQAEYQAGQRDALELILKSAQECEGGCAGGEGGEGGGEGAGDEISEIADTLDAMVESGEITEDEADQVVAEIAQAVARGDGSDGGAAETGDAGGEKSAQAVDPGAGAPAGDAAIDQTVAVDPSQLDPNSVPQGDMSDISAEDVADAIDSLVESGEITEDEADQLAQEIAGGAGGEGGDVSPEEVATALQEAVASGELKPEDVQQVLTELEGVPAPEGGDAGAAGAAPAEAQGEPQAAVPPADDAKTAGAVLLAAIQARRSAKAGK